MFSAYFLTCLLDVVGQQRCAVYYTEMPESITTQGLCNQGTEIMHQSGIDQILAEFPDLVVVRRENGCYPGPLTASEVARDEHAKILNRGISAVFGEIP